MEADLDMYFGDDFGQKIDLTVRIREILRNYPEGTSIFKEMVQNADDAGATEVNFCLDYRQHGSDKLAYTKLKPFQGPSLIVHNNATFTDADFQSIQRIGDSLKKDNSKGWKTGRFGVGFNSVYHVTDLPAFVSGSQLVFFDPQACHLPNVNPSNPGKMINFLTHSELVTNFPDQIDPFRCFGCDFSGPFQGTLFRLALRTEDQAQTSRLSTRSQNPEHVAEMLREFSGDLSRVMLFLRNITKISILEWQEGSDAPTLLSEASINNLTTEVQAKRSLKFASFGSEDSQSRAFSAEGVLCDYMLEILIRHESCKQSEHLKYLISNQLGGGECSKIANNPVNASQRLVPWGGAAVLIPTQKDASSFQPTTGMAFCFLPLPTLTYLPIHVNGYFELSSNRRDIWFGDGLSGDGLLRAQWNLALLSDVIAPCYARAVTTLAGGQQVEPEHHVQLFPQSLPPAPWDTLARSFLKRISLEPCLYSEAEGGSWVSPAASVIVRRGDASYEKFTQWLLDDGFPVVRNLSEELEKVLVKTGTIPSFLLPGRVRDTYKSRKSLHGGNNEAVQCFLDFMLGDLDSDRLQELVSVQFLPIADGTLSVFQRNSNVDPDALDYLCSMGFSRQHSIRALEKVGGQDMEAGLNWLFQNPNPSMGDETRSSFYLIPSAEELMLLEGARSRLLNIDALTTKSMVVLSSESAEKHLNVKKMDYQGFEDMLAVVLPSDWYGKSSVPWDHESEDEPNQEWFRLLWKYIGKSTHVGSFQEKWPIVPTSTGVLTALSKTSGVLSPELIPPGCLKCLHQLGARLLLPNLFSSFQPNPYVWNYIHQPTPAGVLSCIGAVLANGVNDSQKSTKDVFRNASVGDREQLRAFLMAESAGNFDVNQIRVCQRLPIFHGLMDVSEIKDEDLSWVNVESEDTNDSTELLTSAGKSPNFVSLESWKEGDREAALLMCMGIDWKFLDEGFIYVKEGDVAQWRFLASLGVRGISKVEFFASHLIPRFQTLANEARVEFICQLLLELNVLLVQDVHGTLSNIVETANIFPTVSGELKSINDLYDPEIDEFMELMDGSFFPAEELQATQPLSVLRSLGLQRTISRRSILSLAMSIENEHIKLRQQDDMDKKDREEMEMNLQNRSVAFLKYLDSHMEQLMSVTSVQKQKRTRTNIKSKGLKFLRSFGLPSQSEVRASVDQEAEEREQQVMERREIEEFAAQLAVIDWVPVSHVKPHPAAPLHREDERILVTSPQKARPVKHFWLCSADYHIINGVIYSEEMKSIFGWNADFPIETIARQLKQISEKFDVYSAETNGYLDTQLIWSAVYSIYQILSKFFEAEADLKKRKDVLSVLSGETKYVWVGNHFVSSSQVAASASVNAEPYLYTVPSELLHFRPFLKAVGVQERFSLVDYVHVMSMMYHKCKQPLESPDVPENLFPLTSDELVTAIGLIQLISDTLSHHSDYELFAPDVNGVLVHTAKLTFDDTPWLDERGRGATVKQVRFVHPKISNEVAYKLGCKSFRSHLLHTNQTDLVLFSKDGGIEEFGQTEALTKRISHILEQYPDGPNIISELIQNADDAGASRVSLLYNSSTYGVSSLLSSHMAKWQGPALYCYNDAEFSDTDFINLAKIGQANKLQRATTTGRFGLGFNSVYHFTDLPSIVSAKSIVIFDPHATHLPGISAANPGIKIRFTDSKLPDQFPDQFAPFRNIFGCDLRGHYNGTLFRFPLRHAALAEISEIKHRAYSQEDILDLFRIFKASIASTMLFLRNVRKVDVYVQTDCDQPPVLLYGAEVPSEDRGESWRQIDQFMSKVDAPHGTSDVSDVSSKHSFYARLRRTPENQLPSVTQVVRIRSYEHSLYETYVDSIRSGSDSVVEDSVKTICIEKYLVCNQLGGGRARDIACAAENGSLKLIPWAGIAGRIGDLPVEGKAFCFLPLPVKVGLPVHVNGYFELSSNRRDIWHGDDMAGDGKLRSEWNASLLSDAVAPAYLSFLLAAKDICGDDAAQYFSFFPAQLPSGPWSTVVQSLFRIMENKLIFPASPALISGESSSDQPRYLAPRSCVVVDQTVAEWELLEQALIKASLNTIYLPRALCELLVQLNAVQGSMTPAFFCSLIRRGDFLPLLTHKIVGRIVEFCTASTNGSPASYDTLDGLPLLPLQNGQFGTFRVFRPDQGNATQEDAMLYFGSTAEEELLEMFPNRLIVGEFKQYFDALPSFYTVSNVRKMSLETVAKHFFPRILPGHWKQATINNYQVYSLDPTGVHSTVQIDNNWLRKWWKYFELHLQTHSHVAEKFVLKWPIVPIIMGRGEEPKWVPLASNPCLLIEQFGLPLVSEAPTKLPEILSKLGIYIVDASYVNGERSINWFLRNKRGFTFDSNGLLHALSRSQTKQKGGLFETVFAQINAVERQALCNYFASNGADAVSDICLPILRDLPIFPIHTGNAYFENQDEASDEVTRTYTSLRQERIIPAPDADPRVLDNAYFVIESDAVRKLLQDLHFEEWSYTKTLMEHVFPRLQDLEAYDSSLVDAVVSEAILSLPLHRRKESQFREYVQKLPIIPSRKRVLRRVSELHDPNSKELSELVGSSSLPAEAFSTPEIVDALRSLGLRTSLSCHAIVESARSVEALYQDGNDRAIEEAWSKAQSLVKIVNRHFDEMAANLPAEDGSGDADSDSVQDVVNSLKVICWLPVLTQPMDTNMPWKPRVASDNSQTQSTKRLSTAMETRPETDAWLCSYSKDILAEQLTSEVLVAAFGWKEEVEPIVLAAQLEAIGLAFEAQDVDGSDSGLNGHDKQVLVKAQQIYLRLDAAREAEQYSDSFSAVYEKLSNAPWIWTGQMYARPKSVAYQADRELKPLLFAAPLESVISQSFLEHFNIKDSFDYEDYLEALMSLPKGVELSQRYIKACKKVFSLLGEDIDALKRAVKRYPPQKFVLLDEQNRLMPSGKLTYEDMEWNTSQSLRQGRTFVNNEIPKEVAFALGAASLHSQHAESTASSTKISCPSVESLKKVLPESGKVWERAFYSEILLAAERQGATQVDVFVDYRHHPSQRVIQPSLQALQDESICIHVHGVVLNVSAINSLFGGESSRAGFFSGFFFSDCMQILSGDGFYILDPSGSYLASTNSASSGVARRYDILGNDFLGYPDQLLPFTTLPYCPRNVAKGTQSTLIRFPWRKASSALSSFVFDTKKAAQLVQSIKSQVQDSLVFTESLYHVSAWSIGKNSEYETRCNAEAKLESPDETLRKRNSTRMNTEWKKKFSLQSFFKSPVVPENQVEFVIQVDVEDRSYRDTWLLADNIGLGRSRDLACSPVHELLESTPYVSVACHLYRDNNPAPILRGRLYKIVDTSLRIGLPIHVNGCFKKTMKEKKLLISSPVASAITLNSSNGSEAQVKASWNRILLEDGMVDAYMKLLLVAKRRYESNYPKALYNVWPRLKAVKDSNEVGELIQVLMYRSMGSNELFLCTDGSFRAFSNGYLIDLVGMDIQVASFTQLHFPAFSIPRPVLADCSRLLSSRMQSLTPKTMRRFVRHMRASEIHSSVCLPLLEYCLSDLQLPLPGELSTIWSEFNGLPLLPLEDGSSGVIRVNQRSNYVLGSFNQVQLLWRLPHLFISLEARQRLHAYFSDSRFIAVMGLTHFSIKTLSDHIDQILPARWKNQDVVAWDHEKSDEIDRLWLHRFWQEVRFERRSLSYFSAWPLIPVKGSMLVSCGKPDAALCVWRESYDSDIASDVLFQFKVAADKHEEKLAVLENERRELMELSTNKLLKEDVVENLTDDEEEKIEQHEDILSDTEEEEKKDEGESTDTIKKSVNDEAVQRDEDSSVASVTTDKLTAESDETATSGQTNSHATSEEIQRTDEQGEAVVIDMIEEVVTENEYCSRDVLHSVLLRINAAMIELAYFSGQESDIVPQSRNVSIAVLDGLSVTNWNRLRWGDASESDATLLAEFFSHHGRTQGGFNRMYIDMLKKLPIFVNICDVACSIDVGEFYLVPPEINLTTIPLPPNARQCFLKINPQLTAFYRDLGVQEMSDAKLLIYLLPMYDQLAPEQRNIILGMIKQKWQTLRGDSELTQMLKVTPLFPDADGIYQPASAFFDPRNKVLATIYRDAPQQFPVQDYQNSEWLDLMAEIGLHSDISVDIFIGCARRIEALFSIKNALDSNDETLIIALHQYFIQNFERFDRSRAFFETISQIAFVPAILYERTPSAGSFNSRTIVVKYSACATPDDQALVFTTKPILLSSAVPPRILWSRLCMVSPPDKDIVLAHLFNITSDSTEQAPSTQQWQFYLPMVEVFQEIFKYLQTHWDTLRSEERLRVADAAIIPIGSFLVKGSRLYFHLGENLAPLMYEVPRVFGAYDTLFRQLGSKDSPEVNDYILLLQDLHAECRGTALNLNELIAVARVVDLLADALVDSSQKLSIEAKKSIYLPSSSSVMEPVLQMAYNDAPWLCARINLSELHVVHPRILTRWCQVLGVPGISAVVTEELQTGSIETLPCSDTLAHFNSILASQQFGNGVRRIITVQQQKATSNEPFGFIPDFDDINRRIVKLATFEIKFVDTLQSQFIAKLDHPFRKVDVTKSSASMQSLSYLNHSSSSIYIAKRTVEAQKGLRLSQVVAACINQLLGGILQDCSHIESILTCDVLEIDSLLRLMNVYEDTDLIVEKLRGVIGEPLAESDQATIDLTPLHSHLPGEIVAVEMDGHLRYGKIVQEQKHDSGVSQYEVKVSRTVAKWYSGSQIYTFRSARNGSDVIPARSEQDTAFAVSLTSHVLDKTTTGTAVQEQLPASLAMRAASSNSGALAGGVTATTVVSAVNELLSRFNVSLSTEYEDLLSENLRLRQRLEQAEEGRRIASAQIDDAIREKKDAQDTLICAICLENKVDRVLIPCGHIYCDTCVSRLPRPSCPICRQNIASSSTFHVPS